MKRPEFLKNLVAMAVGLVAAPKILKAEVSRPPEWVKKAPPLVKTNGLRKYPLTTDQAWLVPDETVLGKFDEHKLIFYNLIPCRTGDILVDELERKYFICAINCTVSRKVTLTIRDINMNQMKKGRSRRRGLIPRLGKQYMITYRTFQES